MHLDDKCRQIDASDQREWKVNFLQDRRAHWEDSATYTDSGRSHLDFLSCTSILKKTLLLVQATPNKTHQELRVL
jgi:hypothetical protein